MLDEASLPVATRVARREVAKATQDSSAVAGNWGVLLSRVLSPVRDRFSRDRQLTGEAYANLVSISRKTLTASKHVFLEEISRSPTRTRPKGEAHEFFFVARGLAGGQLDSHYSTIAIRLFLSRRKAELMVDWPGLDFTRHLLERTIERRLAAWTGGFAEVDENVVEHAGLLIVWRHLLATGAITNDEVVIPLSNGLMLGQFMSEPSRTRGYRYMLGRESKGTQRLEANPFLCPREKVDAARTVRFMTAVDESLLRMAQVDLRDMLRDFNNAHRVRLGQLAASALWGSSSLRDIPCYADLRPAIQELSESLLPILRTTAAIEGLSRVPIEYDITPEIEIEEALEPLAP